MAKNQPKFNFFVSYIFLKEKKLKPLVNKFKNNVRQLLKSISLHSKKHPIKTRVLQTVFGIFIIGQITYQLSSFFDSLNSHISYDIANIQAVSPQIVNGHIQNVEKKLPKGDNVIFTLYGEFQIKSGQIKDSYLIYSKNDNPNIKSDDFHSLKLKYVPFVESWNYLNNIIPYVPMFYNPPLHIFRFDNKIHYTTKKSQFFYKPFYILTIDKQNNIDIQLLVVKSYSEIYISDTNTPFITNETTLTTPPVYKQLYLSDFIKHKSYSNKYDLNLEQIQKSSDQIIEITKNLYPH